jgi:hypothetical protein
LLSSSTQLQLRARAELELRRRGLSGVSPFARYRFTPHAYIRAKLGWSPWMGDGDHVGQAEIIDAYALALKQQHERRDYEADRLDASQLTTWSPGQVIQNQIRVEAGHTVGKTTLAAGLVSHFFDCFSPAIVYCFAPGHDQINDLLFKEIRKQRSGKGLPGRVLETPEIKDRGDHFVKGRATNNAHGQGTERVQGQHEQYLMFVIDEAEGVAEYVFDAIRSMTSGGISIVLMLANPRTRTSRFHKAAASDRVASFRISCIHHPNVLAGREIVPGAVMRDYVETMIDDGETQHAEVVEAHDADAHTFELPWRPGIIYRPDPEFMFRVLGIAPSNIADDVFVPVGRYEAAKKRAPEDHEPHIARMGVDVARFGKDEGRLYIRHNGRLWRAASFAQLDTNVYARGIKREAMKLRDAGVTSLHIRIDGGGGYGGGVVDKLKIDTELLTAFTDFQVQEVHFNANPHDDEAYADLATEIYGHAAEVLRWIALINPPGALEGDLCERTFTWVSPKRDDVKKDVKKLEDKKTFRKRMHRSPDDGDALALAAAPDRVFGGGPAAAPAVRGSRPLIQAMQRGLRR